MIFNVIIHFINALLIRHYQLHNFISIQASVLIDMYFLYFNYSIIYICNESIYEIYIRYE